MFVHNVLLRNNDGIFPYRLEMLSYVSLLAHYMHPINSILL